MLIAEEEGREFAGSMSHNRVIEIRVDSLASVLLAAFCGGALMILVNESLQLASSWYSGQTVVPIQPYLIGLLCLFSVLVVILLIHSIRRWRYYDQLKWNNMNRIRNLEEILVRPMQMRSTTKTTVDVSKRA